MQGWTNSGTSGSPAASVLLAEVGSIYTDPLGNVTTYQPRLARHGPDQSDDRRPGQRDHVDRNANGLATITIDPLNRITQDAYDSQGKRAPRSFTPT